MYRKTTLPPGIQTGNKAQSTLEMALAVTAALFLLVGGINLFIWLNKLLVLRQEKYEDTRNTVSQVDESQFPKLNILGR